MLPANGRRAQHTKKDQQTHLFSSPTRCLLVRQNKVQHGRLSLSIFLSTSPSLSPSLSVGWVMCSGCILGTRDIWDNMRTRHICWDPKRQTLLSGHSATRGNEWMRMHDMDAIFDSPGKSGRSSGQPGAGGRGSRRRLSSAD